MSDPDPRSWVCEYTKKDALVGRLWGRSGDIGWGYFL